MRTILWLIAIALLEDELVEKSSGFFVPIIVATFTYAVVMDIAELIGVIL